MAVTAEQLENPERSLDLVTREKAKGPPRERDSAAADELKQLRERIEAAKASKPKDSQPHCGDCFQRGWRAALSSIDD